MSETLKYILTFICSGTFMGFIQFLIQRADNKKDKFVDHEKAIKELTEALTALATTTSEQQKILDANTELLVGLAQDKLVSMTDHIQRRGAITLKEQAILTAIYEPYHNKLNGNGHGKAGYEYAMGMSVISEKEASDMDTMI